MLRRKKQFVEHILPEYLSLFFNSIAGKLQAEKWAHGVAFYSVTQEDMGRFVVPILPFPNQEKLRDLLDQSEKHRNNASTLLEAAKHAVEIAIEQSEEAALKYLDSQEATQS